MTDEEKTVRILEMAMNTLENYANYFEKADRKTKFVAIKLMIGLGLGLILKELGVWVFLRTCLGGILMQKHKSILDQIEIMESEDALES